MSGLRLALCCKEVSHIQGSSIEDELNWAKIKTEMNIVFRADASLEIGSGHVMRCLVLADALADVGARCTFICREHIGHLGAVIQQCGHDLRILPLHTDDQATTTNGTAHAHWLDASQEVDAEETLACLNNVQFEWMIVDHYGIDAQWEQRIREHIPNTFVIDDLADRPHLCDALLDQNLGKSIADYQGLIAASCRTFFGPHYALLAPVFLKERDASLARRKGRPARSILITMGGVDKDDTSGWILRELKACKLPEEVKITVIMGRTAPWVENVRRIAAEMPWKTEVFVDIQDMAARMSSADLALGAAGSTSWERCCLGLPSVMLVLAENQAPIAKALAAAGAAIVVDHREPTAGVTLRNAMEQLVRDTTMRMQMSLAAASITDGGGAERVCTFLSRSLERVTGSK